MGDNKPEQSWWWLSFVGRPVAGDTHEGKWLGGCYVEATDLHDAVATAWRLEINPGGEVMGWDNQDEPALHMQYRLITDEAELGKIVRVKAGGPCIDCGKDWHRDG